jgi:hypothetical protein
MYRAFFAFGEAPVFRPRQGSILFGRCGDLWLMGSNNRWAPPAAGDRGGLQPGVLVGLYSFLKGFARGLARNFNPHTKNPVENVVGVAGLELGRGFGGAAGLAVAREGCGGQAQRLGCYLRELVGDELEVGDAGWRRVFAPPKCRGAARASRWPERRSRLSARTPQ